MVSDTWVDDFVKKAIEVWGDRWDYSSSSRIKGTNPVVSIKCRKHGEFTQRPGCHLKGKVGCYKCRRQIKSLDDLIEYSQEVWGEGRWTYERTSVPKGRGKTTFTCPKHGDYKQGVETHLGGHLACKGCRTNYVSSADWVARAVEACGDKWDYSKVDYVDNSTPVTIICPQHGEFLQNPTNHLRGHIGCKKCNGRMGSTPAFIYRAKEVWGDRWDYTPTNYLGYKEALTIRCPEHGDFEQVAEYHLTGKVGCRSCAPLALTSDEVIEKIVDVWGEDTWDLSDIQWDSYGVPIRVVCKKHGTEIYTNVGNLLYQRNCCKKCQPVGTSRTEEEILNFVKSLGVDVIPNDRKALGGTEIDIFIPTRNVGIEYNGLYYHSDKFKDRMFHKDKTDKARAAGITLIHVWEDEWENKRGIVEEHIRTVLGLSSREKVSARKCNVVEVSSSDARNFLDAYHIQGAVGGTVRLGLMYEGSLVAVAVFTKRDNSTYLLSRYATSHTVRGGHSKLVSHFEKMFPDIGLVTFADLAYSYGNLYESTGWTYSGEIPPDYQYVVRNERKHKFSYRKDRFRTDPLLKYVEGMTEQELADLNGLYRIWDSGKIRYCR